MESLGITRAECEVVGCKNKSVGYCMKQGCNGVFCSEHSQHRNHKGKDGIPAGEA